MAENREVVLSVRNLKQYFPIGGGVTVKAVDGVSFDIYKGEVFGLVGESGSGKSTTGRSIIRLYNPTDGEMVFNGQNISGKLNRETTSMLRQKMQMIFQDPMASLNPRMKVIDIIAEGLDIHFPEITEEERVSKVEELLEIVGLTHEHAHRYPHEFSGGQRQRIGIARALITDPDFIIADEPISALDVSIQAQVVNLMRKLQRERGLTYLFIAHDLSMVKYISDRIAVMHLGHIVELGTAEQIYNDAKHPYTKSLLSAIPLPDPIYERSRRRIKYTATVDNYLNRELHEIAKGHFVLANEEELKAWTK